jgi:hypothetical protein
MKGYCCKSCFDCAASCGRDEAMEGEASVAHVMDQLPSTTGACSQEEFAIVLSVAMQESDSMAKTDTSKSGGAKNVSPFNMNLSELAKLGCDSSCANGLGQSQGSYDWNGSVRWLLQGIRGGTAIGDTNDFFNYHRDGTTGWNLCKGKGPSCDCGSKGCKAYRDAIADSARELLKSPSTMANGQRVCEKVPYI